MAIGLLSMGAGLIKGLVGGAKRTGKSVAAAIVKDKNNERQQVRTKVVTQRITTVKLLDVKPKVPSRSSGGVLDRLDSIIYDMIETVGDRSKFEQQQIKKKNLRNTTEAKKERENRLEMKKRFKGLGRVAAPFKSGVDAVMNFIRSVVIGALLVALLDNIEKVIESLKKTYKWMENFVKKIGEVMTPVWNAFKWVVGGGLNLINDLKDKEKNLTDQKDELEKELGKVKKDAIKTEKLLNDTDGSLRKDLEGGNIMPQVFSPLDLKTVIRAGESDDDYGAVFDAYLGGFPRRDEDITNMSINQVVKYQKDYLAHQQKLGIPKNEQSAAVGAYQMLYPEVAAESMGIPLSSKFNRENQDLMAEHYLNAAGQQKFRSGQITAEQYNNQLAEQFASLQTTEGVGVYDEDKINKGRESVLGILKRDESISKKSDSISHFTSYESPVTNNVILTPPPPPPPPSMSDGGGSGPDYIPIIPDRASLLNTYYKMELLGALAKV